jgi:hypothetical protein
VTPESRPAPLPEAVGLTLQQDGELCAEAVVDHGVSMLLENSADG